MKIGTTSLFPKPTESSRWDVWLFLSVSLVSIAIYNLIFFNRYFPLSEGWFSVYAHYILNGSVPYRDFHFFLTPLYPLQVAGFIKLFGYDFISLRVAGIFVILGLASTLYFVLLRLASASVASFVTIFSIIYYQSGVAHITYDFIQILNLYALLSLYFLIRACEGGLLTSGSSKPQLTAANVSMFLLSGCLSACAFFTKQSNGALIVFFSAFAAGLGASIGGFRFTLKCLAVFALGLAIPTALILIWLYSERALGAFFDQALFGALQAKGSMRKIMFAWGKGFISLHFLRLVGNILIALIFLGYGISSVWPKKDDFVSEKSKYRSLATGCAVLILICLCFFLPLLSPKHAEEKIVRPIGIISEYLVIAGVLASLSLFVFHFVRIFLKKDRNSTIPLLISTVSLGMIYGNGTSGGLSEAGVYLGFSLFLCYLLSARSFFNAGRYIFSGLCLSFIVLLALKKVAQPYAWWELAQPDIRGNLVKTDIKYLSGFRLAPESIDVMSQIVTLIEKNSSANDSILTFPNIPVFYLFSDRWPKSPAIVQWFDFLPDALAVQEANRILAAPPKVIVYLELSEFVWKSHEILFRAGKPSGQRKIAEAVHVLTSDSNRYTLKASLPVPNNCMVHVWVRNNS